MSSNVIRSNKRKLKFLFFFSFRGDCCQLNDKIIESLKFYERDFKLTLNDFDKNIFIYRQLPIPQKNGNGTAIPLPSSVNRRSTEKTLRGIPVPNGQGLIRYPSGTPSSENSRPNSPPDSNRGSGIR